MNSYLALARTSKYNYNFGYVSCWASINAIDIDHVILPVIGILCAKPTVCSLVPWGDSICRNHRKWYPIRWAPLLFVQIFAVLHFKR